MLVNQTDKKGAGRINIKIRSHGKKRLNPEQSTTRGAHAAGCPPGQEGVAGQPSRAPPRKVTDNRKVSASRPGRWASRGGIRTGARVNPTEGDNLWGKDPGIKTAVEG